MRTSTVGLILVVSVLALFVVLGSMVPAGGFRLAVLVMVPIALPLTVPETVMVNCDPAGKEGIKAAKLLVVELIEFGQIAPPISPLQLTTNPEMVAGTESAKFALTTLLGPAFFRVML